MKKIFDISIALISLFVLLIPVMIISVCIFLTSKGSIFYYSERIGKNNKVFRMPKFRTMITETPQVASDLLANPEQYHTKIGNFLRKTSLDELPQLLSVINGDMSLVGPRPLLYNQYELIELRTEKGLDSLLPGITGWAQINGRDELSITEKIMFDEEYMKRKSFWFDLKILLLTPKKVLSQDSISH